MTKNFVPYLFLQEGYRGLCPLYNFRMPSMFVYHNIYLIYLNDYIAICEFIDRK